MKKLMMIAALCVSGMVFAQEAEPVPAPECAPCEGQKCECAPDKGPKCECAAGKPCECPKPCKCGEGGERKCPKGGEFRRPGEKGPRHGMRGEHGKGDRPMHHRGPKFKKCDCSPECKGIILLPPDSPEGEPLFKAFPRRDRPGEPQK